MRELVELLHENLAIQMSFSRLCERIGIKGCQSALRHAGGQEVMNCMFDGLMHEKHIEELSAAPATDSEGGEGKDV